MIFSKKMSCFCRFPSAARGIIRSLVLLLLLWLLFTRILCITICHDQRLYPSVCDGDLLIALRTETPAEGDLVVLEPDSGACAARYESKMKKTAIQGVVIFLVRRRGF